jgi:hypothetical protein
MINHTTRLLAGLLITLTMTSAHASYQNLEGLNSHVFNLAKEAYTCAVNKGQIKNPMLTVVDFSKPSYDKRLWVINMKTHNVLYNLRVSHGSNSGDVYANDFSNKIGTHESSLGVFLTDNTYYGHHGYSLRLSGLEKGINNNAYKRDIVMHGSPYVNPAFISEYGRIGRSWGCLALNKNDATKVIKAIKSGSMIFDYAYAENSDPDLKNCNFA